jgi:hypothetical protein
MAPTILKTSLWTPTPIQQLGSAYFEFGLDGVEQQYFFL